MLAEVVMARISLPFHSKCAEDINKAASRNLIIPGNMLRSSACLRSPPLGIIRVRSEADFLLHRICMSSSGTIKTICYDWVS